MELLLFSMLTLDRSAPSDGPRVHLDRFVREVVRQGHRVRLWRGEHPLAGAGAAHAPARAWRLLRSDVHYVRIAGPGIPSAVERLSRLPCRGLRPGAIRVWEFNSAPRNGQYLGWSAGGIARTVEALRGYARQGDRAVVLSEAMENYVRQELGFTRILRSRCGAQIPPRTSEATAGPGLRVVWAGSLFGWNRLDLLVGAARIVLERGYGDITFEIIGGWDGDPGGLPANVTYRPALPYPELSERFACADVGVCVYAEGPADDSSPMKLGDYLAHGLAVLSTPHPESMLILAEARQPGNILPRDERAWAERLIELRRDPALLAAHKASGLELARTKYEWSGVVRQILHFIDVERRRV